MARKIDQLKKSLVSRFQLAFVVVTCILHLKLTDQSNLCAI